MHLYDHLHTVNAHRRWVRRYCFKLGLVWQGLIHDLSKYSPTEFWRSVKYYQGYRSPNDAERIANGVSLSWLHHKGRNRHHFEYWIDYCLRENGSVYIGGCKMPKKYVAEMFCAAAMTAPVRGLASPACAATSSTNRSAYRAFAEIFSAFCEHAALDSTALFISPPSFCR